jgi:PDZ domain/Aspartyl protease
MRLNLCILLACGLSGIACAANERVDAILSANQRAVGSEPRSGSAVYHYGYSGDGLTGVETQTVDLATGAYVDDQDSGLLHGAEGFDTRTPWMRDISGANTPQEGGDRVRVAVSAAYRNANLWWRKDRGGARIEYLGRETLSGTAADHLVVRPRHGVPFDAWFDARTHLLLQIAEPQMFFHTRMVFSDYRREDGVMLAHSVLRDPGAGEAGYEHLTLRNVTFGPARSLDAYSCPRTPLTGVTLAHGATSTTVPFRLLNNHIYVEGRVNGKGPYTFLVDTGGHTLLAAKVIAQTGLTAMGKAPESGAGAKQSSTGFVPVRSISIGGVEMHDQVAFAAEIYSPDIEGIPVDGMVGFELFRRLIVQIDYGHKVLTFTEPGHASLRNAGVALPFVFYDHLPFVRGRIDDMPATFDIDTGSRSELDVTSPAVARYHLRNRYPRGVQAVTGWGVGGPSHSYVVRLHSVTLGNVTVNAPVADLSDAEHGSFSNPNYDGNIGSGFLKRFVVTFDYGHQTMYLRRIEPPPPDIGDFDRSGLWINAAKGGYTVTSVSAGSPAAEAGVQVGDVILKLEGRPAKAEDLSDARELLRTQAAGTHVPMLVKGKSGIRRIDVVLRDQI